MRGIVLAGVILTIFCGIYQAEAKDTMKSLNEKEQAVAEISMWTARGKMPELKNALASGLKAGLTVNETKEILVQLYAYCGFPRSLNALGCFMGC